MHAAEHARRDSNPQPSEPESDALSVEPLAHVSTGIIANFAIYVKHEFDCTAKSTICMQLIAFDGFADGTGNEPVE